MRGSWVATTVLILLVVGGCSGRIVVLEDAADGGADVIVDEASDSSDEERVSDGLMDGGPDAAEVDATKASEADAAGLLDEGVSEEPIVEAGVDSLLDGSVDVSDAGRAVGSITIEPRGPLTTTEAGGQATFTIVLDTMPLASVTVPLKSSNLEEGTVLPTSLTFTTANWNVPQVVTVTGVDDPACDGNQKYTIVTGPAMSADPAYDGVDPPDVLVFNTDNEGGGIIVHPGSMLTTTEKGGIATFTLVLTCRPSADVTFSCTSTNVAEGRVDPGAVVFTRANWNMPAEVTITGVDDTVHDGDQMYRVRVGPAVSSDVHFNGIVTSVSVTNIDDD